MLAAIVLFPLVPWLMAGSVEDRFTGSATLKSVANLAALSGIAAWAVTLVLSSRIRPVERAVGGVELLYPLHRRLGVIVATLATTHVVFLTLHAGSNALDLYLPAAGLSLGYRLIGARLGVGRYDYDVANVRHLDDDVVEIVLAPVGRPLEFRAGQFVYATSRPLPELPGSFRSARRRSAI